MSPLKPQNVSFLLKYLYLFKYPLIFPTLYVHMIVLCILYVIVMYTKHINYSDVFCTLDSQRHPLRLYLEYVGHLYQKMEPLPEQERFEVVILPYVCNIGMA